jgi:hypothetical protein
MDNDLQLVLASLPCALERAARTWWRPTPFSHVAPANALAVGISPTWASFASAALASAGVGSTSFFEHRWGDFGQRWVDLRDNCQQRPTRCIATQRQRNACWRPLASFIAFSSCLIAQPRPQAGRYRYGLASRTILGRALACNEARADRDCGRFGSARATSS